MTKSLSAFSALSTLPANTPPMPTVLVVDNSEISLRGCSANIKSAGFRVVAAGSVAGAEQALQTGRVHVAVIDIRLTNNDDITDVSGAELARRMPAALGVVFQSYFLKEKNPVFLSRLSIDLRAETIDKDDKDAAVDLIEAIKRQFETRVRINFDLKFVCYPGDLRVADLVLALSPAGADVHETMPGNRVQASSVTWHTHQPGAAPKADPSEAPQTFEDQVSEMEDLLRKIFFEAKSIRLLRFLWTTARAVALLVEAGTDEASEGHVVVLQRKPRATALPQDALALTAPPRAGVWEHEMKSDRAETRTPAARPQEARAQDERAQDERAATALGLRRPHVCETFHYQGWRLQMEVSPHELVAFDHFAVRVGKQIKPTLQTLLMQVLARFEKESPGVAQGDCAEALRNMIQAQYDVNVSALSPALLQQRLAASVAQLKRHGWQAHYVNDHVSIRASAGDAPLEVEEVGQRIHALWHAVSYGRLIRSPGLLTLPRILISGGGAHVWLTDFENQGDAPAGWDFAGIEASLRADLAYRLENMFSNKILSGDQHLFERVLAPVPGPASSRAPGHVPGRVPGRASAGNAAWHKPEVSLLSKPLSIYADAIGHVRNLAQQSRIQPATYRMCLLTHLVMRWLNMPPTHQTPADIRSMASLLMAIAATLQTMAEDAPQNLESIQPGTVAAEASEDSEAEQVPVIAILDEDERKVRVRDEERALSKTSFRLLKYMLGRYGRVCKYADIYNHMQDESLHWEDRRENKDTLNQWIHRLRKELDDGASSVELLVNVRDVGYRLGPRLETGST